MRECLRAWAEIPATSEPSPFASELFDVDADDTTEKPSLNGEEAVSFMLSLRECEGVIVIGAGGEANVVRPGLAEWEAG